MVQCYYIVTDYQSVSCMAYYLAEVSRYVRSARKERVRCISAKFEDHGMFKS